MRHVKDLKAKDRVLVSFPAVMRQANERVHLVDRTTKTLVFTTDKQNQTHRWNRTTGHPSPKGNSYYDPYLVPEKIPTGPWTQKLKLRWDSAKEFGKCNGCSRYVLVEGKETPQPLSDEVLVLQIGAQETRLCPVCASTLRFLLGKAMKDK